MSVRREPISIILLACAGAALVAAACGTAPTVVQGAGGIVAEARAMPYFTSLRVRGAYEVHVVAGTMPDVTLYADASLLPYIETSIDKDTLSVGTRTRTTLRPSRPPRLDIFTGQLVEVVAAGTGSVDAARLSGDSFAAHFTGAEGGTLAGAVRRLRIDVSGTAVVDARRLAADVVDVAISGVGDVTVAARDRLTVTITGTGTVRYTGHPGVTQHVTGVGEVRPVD